MLLHTQIDLQYLSSSPLQPGRHWVADSLSASRESHPLRGSLRAVSGSTIIILAVMAYIGSCPMVSDGILAQPLLFQEGHRVPHRWLSPGLMSQCLTIQFSMYSRAAPKKTLYYIWTGRDHFNAPPKCPILKTLSFCRTMLTETAIFDVLLWFWGSDHRSHPCIFLQL